MAWNFTADSENLKELASKLNTAADNYDGKVDAMYSQIDTMGSYWVGEDYNMYKDGTEGYRTALSDLSEGIRMFAKHFEKVAGATEELAVELQGIVNDLTGSGGQGSFVVTSTGGASENNGTNNGIDGVSNYATEASVSGGSGTSTGNPSGSLASNPGGTTTTTSNRTSTGNSSEYFIQRGDQCTVHGKNVSFYGRDGSYNYYKDENGMIYVDEGGSLQELTNEGTFNINYLKDVNGGWYGAVNSSSADAAQMGLPDSSSVTASNAPYDDYGMSEYVRYGSIDESQAVYPTKNDSFSEYVNQHQPVIRVANTVDVPFLTHGSNMKVDETGYVTLVYDDRAGKYYRLGTDGTYERDMYGYDPSELATWGIE